jgi:hypothetical protein
VDVGEPIVTSVIAARARSSSGRIRRRDRHAWMRRTRALVDSLVRPGHPSTPGYNDPQYPFYGASST